jgi:hypothetical protein
MITIVVSQRLGIEGQLSEEAENTSHNWYSQAILSIEAVVWYIFQKTKFINRCRAMLWLQQATGYNEATIVLPSGSESFVRISRKVAHLRWYFPVSGNATGAPIYRLRINGNCNKGFGALHQDFHHHKPGS